MNLEDTVVALEEIKSKKYPQGIIVAQDLGAHRFCSIASNCPIAVKLRQVMEDAGISLTELAASFISEELLLPFDLGVPEIDGKITVRIGSQNIDLDIADWIAPQIARGVREKRREFQSMRGQIERAGVGLYHTYLNTIKDAKKQKTLPQLCYSMEELLKYQCTITRDMDRYLLLFPISYSPRWVWRNERHDGEYEGVRYELSERDVVRLHQRIYVVFPINQGGVILSVYLISMRGTRFSHYHGSQGDCWGDVKIPKGWDGTLKQLSDISYQLQAALTTINKDSLMMSSPPGMPFIDDLMGRATFLGAEGVKREEALEGSILREETLDEAFLHAIEGGARAPAPFPDVLPEDALGAPEPRRWGNRR